jgi:hypothetical protein
VKLKLEKVTMVWMPARSRVMMTTCSLVVDSANSSLSGIMRDMKKHTSLQLKDAIVNNLKESKVSG